MCVAAITTTTTTTTKKEEEEEEEMDIVCIYFTHQSFQHAIMPFLIPVGGSPTVTGFTSCFFSCVRVAIFTD